MSLPQVAAESRLGTTLSEKWKVDKLIGVGGMGAVYRALHVNNGRAVAIKVLHAEYAANQDLRKRFAREGYIANQIAHPGAVAVLDDGVAPDGAPYLVMELLEGQSLRDLGGSASKVSVARLLEIVIKVLDVLEVAHEVGVVHRDLKPDNVFVTHDGNVKVVDFGVARQTETVPGAEKTASGIVMGTPEYMAPEQARGRTELVDGRSDLWSVGAMIYRMLVGRPPRDAETNNEVLLLAMTEPVPSLALALPEVDPQVQSLVDRAMAFRPAERYQSAREMREQMEKVLAHVVDNPSNIRATLSLPPVKLEALRAASGPRTRWPLFASVGVGLLLAGTALALRGRTPLPDTGVEPAPSEGASLQKNAAAEVQPSTTVVPSSVVSSPDLAASSDATFEVIPPPSVSTHAAAAPKPTARKVLVQPAMVIPMHSTSKGVKTTKTKPH